MNSESLKAMGLVLFHNVVWLGIVGWVRVLAQGGTESLGYLGSIEFLGRTLMVLICLQAIVIYIDYGFAKNKEYSEVVFENTLDWFKQSRRLFKLSTILNSLDILAILVACVFIATLGPSYIFGLAVLLLLSMIVRRVLFDTCYKRLLETDQGKSNNV